MSRSYLPFRFSRASSFSLLRCLAASLLVVTATSCSGGDTTEPENQPPVVVSVSVAPSSATLVVNAERQLEATAMGASGAITGRTVTWSSEDNAVATVSNTGLVHAVGTGTTTIDATVDGKTGSATITVQNPAPVLTAVTPPSAVAHADALTLTATGSAFASGAVLEWNGSTRPTTVNSATQLTATLEAGDVAEPGEYSVRIRNPTPGGGLSAPLSFIVTPVPVASVTLEPTEATLVPSEQRTLAATTLDAVGSVLTGRAVTFTSDNAAVATVGANTGVVQAVAEGTATITATSEGQNATATITVLPGALVGAAGGEVTAGSVTLIIPAGAVSVPTAFTIEPIENPPASATLVPGTAVRLGPENITFSEPVTVEMKWTAEQETSLDPSRFAVHRHDGSSWNALPDREIDVANRTVRGTTTSFSPFAIHLLPEELRLADSEIVFVLDEDLYVIDVNTKQQRPLGIANGFTPAISLDRKRIAFTRQVDNQTQIFTASYDGGNVQRISTSAFQEGGPTFDAGGNRLFFTRDLGSGNRKIFSMNPDGSGATQHTFATNGTLPHDGDPVVSPDGLRIAMERSPLGGNGFVALANLSGGNVQQLSNIGAKDPAWSPDGQRIAYIDGTGNDAKLVTVKPDGTDFRIVAQFDDGAVSSPSWSPDGTRLVFALLGQSTDFRFQLFVVDAEGGEAEQLTNGNVSAWSPRWSRN